MLIAAALIIGFNVLAGMVSMVSIDIFNGSVILLTMLLALPCGLFGHGGVDAVPDTVRQAKPSHVSVLDSHDVF